MGRRRDEGAALSFDDANVDALDQPTHIAELAGGRLAPRAFIKQ
jgi:hypothetical protein